MEIKPILIPEIDYTRLPNLQCMSRIIEVNLKMHGYDYVEDFIGRELCFYEYQSVNNKKLSRRCKGFFEELETDYGVKVITKEYENADEAWNHTLELLSKGIPATVGCDSFYLPFNAFKYQKIHSRHYLIINGYSAKDNMVTIYDGNFKIFNKEMSLDVFKDARESECGGFPIKNTSVQFNFPEKLKEPTLEDFILSMESNIKKAFNSSHEDIFINNTFIPNEIGDYRNYGIGIRGMREVADKLDSLLCDNLYDKTYKLFYFFTELTEQTELHMNYVKRIGERYNILEIKDMIEDIDYIIQNWLVSRNIFLKGLIKAPEDMIFRGKNKLRLIADLEEKYFSKMDQIVQRLKV